MTWITDYPSQHVRCVVPYTNNLTGTTDKLIAVGSSVEGGTRWIRNSDSMVVGRGTTAQMLALSLTTKP